MHLHKLPNELIHNIAFLVVAHDPLGPPAGLVPLLTISKRIHAALLSPHSTLKARIFRLKFDSSAVARRSFSPYDLHLAQQLECYCRLLRVVKSKDVDHEDVANFLFDAYLMMLDNDGKNYAQLEWAGITGFVDDFIRLHLWDGRTQNGNAGWPLASLANRCALWVAWLTMDRVNLFKEPIRARNDFVTLIFPFTLLSPRYPSTEAPPNHFHLPLLPESPTYQRPLVSSSNPQLPPYPHYTPHPAIHQPYFGSIQNMTPPLISIAAKLLFTVRKEIFPINIPQILPPGLRPEDYAEFNKGKAAEVPRGARWDWNRGCAVAVNSTRVRNAFKPVTKEECEQFELVRNQAEVIADGDEESRRWDEDWWRRILCADLKSLRPKFPPGLVYKPGTLRGTWQGRLYMPLAEALHSALETYPFYPGYPTEGETPGNMIPTFSEASTNLVMLPVFFNVEEHHRVCHCPSYHLRDKDDTRDVHYKGCGTIPVPLPSLLPPRYMRWRGAQPHMVVVPPEEDEGQVEAGEPAQNNVPNGEAQPSSESTDESAAPEVQENLVFGVPSDEVGAVEGNTVEPGANNLLTMAGNSNTNAVAPLAAEDTQPEVQTALPAPVVPLQSEGPHEQNPTAIPTEQDPPAQPQPGNAAQQDPPDLLTFLEKQRQTNPRIPRLVPTPIDYSMNNAYFPGDVVPSLMSLKRKVGGAGSLTLGGRKRRDEIVFGFRELGMGGLASQAGQPDWKAADGRCATDKEGKGVGLASEGEMKEESGQKQRQLYVYETYDPEKESVHDVSVCQTCKEWEDVRRKERRAQQEACERKLERMVEKEDERRTKEETATRMLEKCMNDYAKRSGISAGVSSSSTDFEPLDTKFGQNLSDAITAAAAKSAAIGLTRANGSAAGVSAPVSGAASEPSDSDHESGSSFSEDELSSCYSACSSEDEDEDADDDDEDEDDDSNSQPRPPQSRRLSVLGDDLPHGQSACFDPHSQEHIPSTRRIFDRTRVGAPEGCSGGVRDIVITGETPRRHVAWHRQMYRLYGRVRSWDGMIGLLRVDERSLPGYTTGMQNLGEHLEESEYWSVITNMFICGYIVGGKTFVGEWRMAASDPLKPGWSGPILMSLRVQEDGEEPVWEPVGGEAI